MRTRCSVLAACGSLLALLGAATSVARAEDAAGAPPLKTACILVDRADSPAWTGLEAFLNAELEHQGSPLRIVLTAVSADEALTRLAANDATCAGAVLSPLRYVLADTALDDLHVVARMRRSSTMHLAPGQALGSEGVLEPPPRESYRSIIAMNRRGGAGTWPPLPGSRRRFASLGMRSTSSHLLPMMFFLDRGWLANGAIEPVVISGATGDVWDLTASASAAATIGSDRDLLLGLRSGDYDLIGLNDDRWDRFVSSLLTPDERLATAVVHTTDPVLFDPLVVRGSRLTPGDRAALRDALLTTRGLSRERRGVVFPWHRLLPDGKIERWLAGQGAPAEGAVLRRSPQIHDWTECHAEEYDDIRRAAVLASGGEAIRLAVSARVHPTFRETDAEYFTQLKRRLMRGGDRQKRIFLSVELRSADALPNTLADLASGALDMAELPAFHASEAVGQGLGAVGIARFAGGADETHYRFLILTNRPGTSIESIETEARYAHQARDSSAGFRWPMDWLAREKGGIAEDRLVACPDAAGVALALLDSESKGASRKAVAEYGFMADYEWRHLASEVLSEAQAQRIRPIQGASDRVPNAVLVASRSFCPRFSRWEVLDAAPQRAAHELIQDPAGRQVVPDSLRGIAAIQSLRAAVQATEWTADGTSFRGYAPVGRTEWEELMGTYERFHSSAVGYLLVAFALIFVGTGAGLLYRTRASMKAGGAEAVRAGLAAGGKPAVFLCYRRSDSQFVVPLLPQFLGEEFRVLYDSRIPKGTDFRQHLDRMVGQCDAVVAVIGDRWLEARGPGEPNRLFEAGDWVRVELEAALARDIPVVPLLLGTGMPQEGDLPESLRALTFRNAQVVHSGAEMQASLSELAKDVRNQVRLHRQRTLESRRARVFVSRATEDAGFVRGKLAPLLARHGLHAWTWREALSSEQDWEATVLPSLEKCDWFLLVISPAALGSPWIMREASWARRNRLGRMTMLLLHDVDRSGLGNLDGVGVVDCSDSWTTGQAQLLRALGDGGVVQGLS